MALTVLMLGIIAGCFIAARLPAIYADWRYRRKMAELGFTHGTTGFPEWDDVPD